MLKRRLLAVSQRQLVANQHRKWHRLTGVVVGWCFVEARTERSCRQPRAVARLRVRALGGLQLRLCAPSSEPPWGIRGCFGAEPALPFIGFLKDCGFAGVDLRRKMSSSQCIAPTGPTADAHGPLPSACHPP